MKKKILLVILIIAAIASFKYMHDRQIAKLTRENIAAQYRAEAAEAELNRLKAAQNQTTQPETPASEPAPQPETPAPDPAQQPDATAPEPTEQTEKNVAPEPTVSLEEQILELASLKPDPDRDRIFCEVDTESEKNPYSVDWDYGKEYDKFTKNLDWSLIFDADFYMEKFPALAMQYQYDEALLLDHFRTVGIHEGRLAGKKFSVEAYMTACPQRIRSLFGDNYAAYTLYYLTEGYKETDPADVMASGSSKKMLTAVMTVVQKRELEQINAERERLGIKPLVYNPELTALAEFRAWVDAKEGWKAHDWLKAPENKGTIDKMYDIMETTMLSENTVKGGGLSTNWYTCYKNSKLHYEAMINNQYMYLGISNPHTGPHEGTRIVQFDMFLEKNATTPLE